MQIHAKPFGDSKPDPTGRSNRTSYRRQDEKDPARNTKQRSKYTDKSHQLTEKNRNKQRQEVKRVGKTFEKMHDMKT